MFDAWAIHDTIHQPSGIAYGIVQELGSQVNIAVRGLVVLRDWVRDCSGTGFGGEHCGARFGGAARLGTGLSRLT
jgi:hypothetical protein